MPVQVTCPSRGAELDDSAASCPACGFQGLPATIEDLVACWVTESPVAESLAPPAQQGACLSCGFEGSMIACPEGDRVLCPACSNPWNDRGGIVRQVLCPDCGQTLLLTDEQIGKMIICSQCRSLLGCLIKSEKNTSGRRLPLFDLMALVLAFATGYSVAFPIFAEKIPWALLRGISVIWLPVTWMLVVLRLLSGRPARRRVFPPGLAACLAVAAASLLSLCYGWDRPFLSYGSPRGIIATAALRAVEPLPLAAAVAAIWLVLLLDRRWKPEPSWIDRLGRGVALYWLTAGLIPPVLHLFGL